MPLASFPKTFGFTKKGAISEHENYMTIYERIKREKWEQLPNKRVTNTRITIETISDQKLHYKQIKKFSRERLAWITRSWKPTFFAELEHQLEQRSESQSLQTGSG